LTADVTSTSTVNDGTVDFTDGGVTISGCGAEPVTSGQATCTTTFTTEGNHALEALYSGTTNFGPSNGTLTQQVNDPTTVTGSSYCNTGSITLNNPPDTVADASPYPSRVFVSGLTGTLSDLTVSLEGVTYSESQDIDALLVGPAGQSFILAADAGPNSGGAISNVTLTLSDAAASTLAQSSAWGAANASVTSKPFNYGGVNETWAPPAPAGPYGTPGTAGGGTATLGSVFNGTNPNGTWSLYVITTAAGDGTGSIAGGWCANITSAAIPATNTTIASSNNPSFTASPGDSVTFAAGVTKVSDNSNVGEGNVDFQSNGVTIAGCGAVAVNAGTATCTTTFSTEGTDSIEALYSGDSNFAPSNATLSQEVDDHTTVTSGSQFCNTGAITLNNPDINNPEIGASPYPSHIFIPGMPGPLTNLTVTLSNVTYSESQDIDALLVGPGGQSLILVAAAGPDSGGALSNVTLELSDAAASQLSQSAAWGVPNATVTSKPVAYPGGNELFPSPAPAGPYNNPAILGSSTLSSEFGGTNPGGTWSLYVITTAAGDGTGAIAGGWCLNTTITKGTPAVSGVVSPSAITIGTTFSDTATVEGPSPNSATDISPAGTVTFNVYGPNDPTCANAPAFTSMQSLAGGSAGPVTANSRNFTPNSAGTYFVTATYNGDSNYNSGAATSCGGVNESVVVTKASPALPTMASASVPLGQQITDSADLTGATGADGANGTITFNVYGPDDADCTGTPAFTSALVIVAGNGVYGSGDFTPTAGGTYRWIASYSGDANNNAVAGACNAANESVVVQVSSGTTLSSSLNPSIVGQSVTFRANVTGTSPTGTVTFTDGSNELGTGTLNSSGVATFAISSLSVGSHVITAVYGGDASNATSTSNALTQVVNPPAPGAPTITITTPKSHANYGFRHLVHAKYNCADGADGPGIKSCTGTVPNGARVNTRTPGNHKFTVTAVSKDGKTATKTVTYHVGFPSNHIQVLEITADAAGKITVKQKLPGPGTINYLVTASNDNLASAAKLLQPAAHQFVFARKHVTVSRAGVLTVTVRPNARGKKLLAHPAYPIVVRLWVSYTPTLGKQRNDGFYSIHFPSQCRARTAHTVPTHAICSR
jgi:hypothetical protein